MEVIKVDFSKCKYYDDLHKVLKETFNFPDYYGKNVDALWDCIGDILIYSSKKDILVEVYGTKNMPSNVMKNEMKLILKIFNRVHEYCSDVVFKIMS